jgi:hypothetical protein
VNPYVFFVGCPRSGTTLLRRIGDAHPELAITRELHWLPSFWEERIGITSDGFVTPKLVDRLLADRRFRRLGVDEGTLSALVKDSRPKHYARLVTELFDLHGKARGKRLVGEKTPRYVHQLPTLHALWPHAKVVHLIRDGRDVCLSVLDWQKGARNFSTWEADPVSTTALFWEWNVRLGREMSARLGASRYLELRYESLIEAPEGQCRALCAFLGVRYDAAMLRFHEGRTREDPRLDAKKAWLPVTRGLRSWKTQMSGADVVRFEAAAGALLADLGYERLAPTPLDDDAAHAAQMRRSFDRDLRARGLRVPEAWEAVAA